MQFLNKFAMILTAFAVTATPGYAASGDQSENGSETGREWSETLESIKTYSAEQRDKALRAGKETLDAMDERIDALESWTEEQWDSLSAETRDERAATMNYLRKQRNEASEWYGGMKHSSAEAWSSVKQGFIDSYNKLQDAYDDAVGSMNTDEEQDNAGTAEQ